MVRKEEKAFTSFINCANQEENFLKETLSIYRTITTTHVKSLLDGKHFRFGAQQSVSETASETVCNVS